LEYEKAIIIRNKIKTLEKYISNYLEDTEKYYIYFSDFLDNSIFIAVSKIYSNELTNILKNTFIFQLENTEELTKEEILLNTILEYIPNTNTPKEIKTNYYNNSLSELSDFIKNVDNNHFKDISPDLIIKLSKIKLESIDYEKDKEVIDYLENLIKNAYLRNQRFNKENIIKKLASILEIKSINRIECIDVSHFYGENVYGALIVFEKDKLKKDKYRIFKLHNKFDDISNIKELLTRRIKYLIDFENYKDKSLNLFPQVILIDGGKSQLKAAYEILKNYPQLLTIKLISIVKPKDEILYLDISDKKNKIVKLDLRDIEVWNFLRMLRDEAHNYANAKRIKYTKLFAL